jgi:dUTP pyrophosphatase
MQMSMDDCYARIAPRSGLAARHSIDVMAGVIDADHTGEIKVVLINHGEQDVVIKMGDRIAQMVFERIYLPEIEEVAQVDVTQRGAGGFGSTGQ